MTLELLRTPPFDLFEVVCEGNTDVLDKWTQEIKEEFQRMRQKGYTGYPGWDAKQIATEYVAGAWREAIYKKSPSTMFNFSIYAMASRNRDMICWLVENNIPAFGYMGIYKPKPDENLLANFATIIYEQNEVIKRLTHELQEREKPQSQEVDLIDMFFGGQK
jgi:hypothetical protein